MTYREFIKERIILLKKPSTTAKHGQIVARPIIDGSIPMPYVGVEIAQPAYHNEENNWLIRTYFSGEILIKKRIRHFFQYPIGMNVEKDLHSIAYKIEEFKTGGVYFGNDVILLRRHSSFRLPSKGGDFGQWVINKYKGV